MKTKITLEGFLEACAEMDGNDPEIFAVTEALNQCYDLLGDEGKAAMQESFPRILTIYED